MFNPHYSGLSAERLTALINATNNTDLVEGVDFNYGAIKEVKVTGANTQMQILFLGDLSGYKDRVFYNRIDLKHLAKSRPQLGQEVYVAKLPTTSHDLIEQLNLLYGTDLRDNDIEFKRYSKIEPVFEIVASAQSLAWIGSIYMTVRYNVLELSDWLGVTELSGLVPPSKLAFRAKHMRREVLPTKA